MKLFVGNLAWEVTSDDLRSLFAGAGNVVDAVVLMDKMTGRSRGFGFVEFASADEAKAAVEKFNGADLKGRKINVNEARPMQPRQ
ncbi:MAG: RNA recognition motif domain-containing protein [Microgenomates group bacterium]